MTVRWHGCALTFSLLGSACYAGLEAGHVAGTDAADTTSAGDRGTDAGDQSGSETGEAGEDELPRHGFRRLSAAEYHESVRDILGIDDLPSEESLPTDPHTPFDNDIADQFASDVLVRGVDLLAEAAAEAVLIDTELRDALLGCVPASPADEACMRTFVGRVGRRALRRPLSPEEIDAFVLGNDETPGALAHAEADGAFDVGVEFVVRVLLSDPEFIYRVEIGTPVDGAPGVYRLTAYEVAARMSYLLWGSGPDDELLDAAQSGALESREGVGEAAMRMLDNPRAVARVERLHAMWLGYEGMKITGELSESMGRESAALIERVMFEDARPWQDIFTEPQTFVDAALAEHYDLPQPVIEAGQDGAWVDPVDDHRRGILGHGSYLSLGAKGKDTSPVLRGNLVQKRLLCFEVPEPDANVNTDVPPQEGACKPARYAQHRQAECASCHAYMDPVGFGLENYDGMGRFRTHESDLASTDFDESTCAISGAGEGQNVGAFSGPAELAEVALASGLLQACFMKHVHQFVVGRSDLDEADDAAIARLTMRVASDFSIQELLLEIVTDESFVLRRT